MDVDATTQESAKKRKRMDVDATTQESAKKRKVLTMAPKHVGIKDITPLSKKNWTVKVMVQERSSERISTTTLKSFQRLVFIDKEGTKVQASIFGTDIGLFTNTLKPLHKYLISNANVSTIDKRFQIIPNEYQWVITGRTPIVELTNDEDASAIMPDFNFVSVSDLAQYTKTSDIDIVAAVVDMHAERHIETQQGAAKIQELLLLTQENKPIMLTVWDHFVDNKAKIISEELDLFPIIVGMHLRVAPYHDLSLTTRASSSFLINPEIPEAETLHSWIIQNHEEVSKTKFDGQQANRRSSIQKSLPIVQVADLPTCPAAV